MRYIVPLVAIVLIGAALRLSGTYDRIPAAAPRIPAESGFQQVLRAPVGHGDAPPLASPVTEKERPATTQASPAKKSTAPDPLQGLGLSTMQRTLVDDVLRERAGEIAALHERIRKSGVLDIADFEWQVLRLKAEWYRKIDRLLDSVQRPLFAALVEKGFFNDGLAITIDPGMTVLE